MIIVSTLMNDNLGIMNYGVITMTDRDRLIELYNESDTDCNSKECDSCEYLNTPNCMMVKFIDKILANGVIVPPCKAGDTIYFDTYKHGESIGIQPHKVANISIVVSTERPFGCVGADIYDREFGKTVFLTYEEAENALKEREL